MTRVRHHRLSSSSLHLVTDPALGCQWISLKARIDGRWRDLTWIAPARLAGPFRCSAYVMAPWCNRIRNAAFPFGGSAYRLRSNCPDGSAIHGDVAARPWRVLKATHRRLVARLDTRDRADFNFPFPLVFEQDLRVDRTTVRWSMGVRNRGTERAPVGFGLHPFFLTRSGGEEADVTVPARYRYPSKNALPTGDPVPARGALHRDACYTRFTGPIGMRFPRQGFGWELRLGRGMDHAYVYAPPFRKDVLCVEPMTLCVDAFNRYAAGKPGTGVKVLQPGERWETGFTFELQLAL